MRQIGVSLSSSELKLNICNKRKFGVKVAMGLNILRKHTVRLVCQNEGKGHEVT